jgi:3',5'-cyclic-AMP phosphodiesterase
MRKIVWATDIHLDHATEQKRLEFANKINETQASLMLITGDIANGISLNEHLRELQKRIQIPIIFNLGNHDYYGSSIAKVQEWASRISAESDAKIHWIEKRYIVELNKRTCLIGVDGWGDGQLGKPLESKILLNDWDLIAEFKSMNSIRDREARMRLLKKLGEDSASLMRSLLLKTISDDRYKHIYIMTHVPPWKEATWHEGAHSDDSWLPWFSCKSVGDAITDTAKDLNGKKITVLCGHVHGNGHSHITENIEVYTGGAQYKEPCISKVIEIESMI